MKSKYKPTVRKWFACSLFMFRESSSENKLERSDPSRPRASLISNAIAQSSSAVASAGKSFSDKYRNVQAGGNCTGNGKYSLIR